MSHRRVTIVSNRLPVRLERIPEGWVTRRSDGGLVAALEPVLRERGGTWVGWTGAGGVSPDVASELSRYGIEQGFDLVPVDLSTEEHAVYYQGACNEALWPLLHGLTERARNDPRHAPMYQTVNRRFARAVAEAGVDGTVWVHDYHLLQMGEELRRALPRARLGFFFHTPFSEREVMARLPWGARLLRSLACFDLVGFQTRRDRRNFLDWSQGLGLAAPAAALEGRTGVFPISLDWEAFHGGARAPEVVVRAEEIRRELHGRAILLGVDRLDYTKGLPHRLRAFERMLEHHPHLVGRVVMVQLSVPSRAAIPEYQRVRAEVEALVAGINGRFARDGEPPIRYRYGSWDRNELLAWYAAADVTAVTPLRDGMNLVAKEFVAASHGEGVLVLSPGAGAAEELACGALLADPVDVDALARTLAAALTMPAEERRTRLHALQGHVREHDVHRWASSFLERLADAGGDVRSRHRPARSAWVRGELRPTAIPAPSGA